MTPQQSAALAKHYLFAFPKFVSSLKCPRHIKFTADKIQEKLNSPNKKKFKLLMVSFPPRHGKPVDEESLVLMGDGSLKKLKYIKVNDTVITHKGRPRKISNVYIQGELECVNIETSSGRIASAALDHPYLTSEGWVNAGDIKEGMYLVSLGKLQKRNYLNETDKELCEARLAGYFVGDGCCVSAGTTIFSSISCNDKIEAEDIRYCINKLGFKEGNSVGIEIRIKNGSRKWLRKIDLSGQTSHTKRVPKFIFKGSDLLISNFIGAYFSCDGSINKRGGKRKDACVEFYSVNKFLLKDIQHLLIRIGIQSTLKLKNGKYNNKKHISWRLSITSQDDIKKFTQKIPIYSEKNKILYEWNYYRQTFDQKFITDKVVKITKNIKRKCRCLNVKRDHTFIADDFIVHNTLLISKHAVPWYIGNNPDKRVILTSYSSDLSDQNSDYAKEIFAKWGPILWNTYPSKTLYNRDAWNTNKGGGCVSAGIGGGITGFGADLFIIDDYFKNEEEAESMASREKLWEKWRAVVSSRLHPGCLVVILATRWNDDDLIGRLISKAKIEKDKFPFDYEYINLPAIAEENDPLGREVGEALWRNRYDEEQLADVKSIVGSYWWNALYQGRPTKRGGNLFKSQNFRYYTRDTTTWDYLCWRSDEEEPLRIRKSDMKITTIVDPALEIKKKSDPCGMHSWAYSRKYKIWLLLDRFNDRIEHQRTNQFIKTFAFKNNSHYILVENEKLGKVIVKQSEGKDKIGNRKIPFKEVPNKGLDKYTRATPMASYCENERVFFPKDAQWLFEFEENLKKFPSGGHDEDADLTAYAASMEDTISVAEVLANY